jgi:hypothetical protein
MVRQRQSDAGAVTCAAAVGRAGPGVGVAQRSIRAVVS